MLIITEKESVAENYARALGLRKVRKAYYEKEGGDLRLTHAQGHLFKLYDWKDYSEALSQWRSDNMPFVPKVYRFKKDYGKGNGKKWLVETVLELLKDARRKGEEVIVATDPDREGEVIARLILGAAGIDTGRCTRIWCKEGLCAEEIVRAFGERKPLSEYEYLSRQGLCQKESDWVMGTNLTRAYTLINDGTLYSVGRVQTAVLKEIYRRHMEIFLFHPRRYSVCSCQMASRSEAFLINPGDSSNQFFERGYIDSFLKEDIREAECREVRKERKEEKPPYLYDLARLEQDAFHIYGIPVKKCEEYAQGLYNERGVMSYPRTDSFYLGSEDVEKCRELFREITGKDGRFRGLEPFGMERENTRVFNDKKKGAHHALIPTRYYPDDGSEEWKVYDLVLRRFMMVFMKAFVTERTEITWGAGVYVLKSSGVSLIEEGWKKYDLHKMERMTRIECAEGKMDGILSKDVREDKTRPPAYYNEGTILAFMRNPRGEDEEDGPLHSIGTEATQASIIQTLFEREYIRGEKKHIAITDKGIRIVELVKDNPLLDKNTDVEATTEWEELGKKDPDSLLRGVEELTVECIRRLKKDMEIVVEKKKVCVCPACGGDILRGSRGYYCSNWKEKECRNSVSSPLMGNKIDDDFIRKVMGGEKSGWMMGVTKSGSDCRFRVSLGEDRQVCFEYDDSVREVCRCPSCGGKVRELQKSFRCASEGCEFILWKESSGMRFSREDVVSLCSGKEIEKRRTRKDGKEVLCMVRYDPEGRNLVLGYK